MKETRFLLLSLLAAALAAGCSDGNSHDGDAGNTDTARSEDAAGVATETSVAEEISRDGKADGPAADAPPVDLGEAVDIDGGCSGWTTLARISPAAALELIATVNPIVINVHVPSEGDIPGTDMSIPYDDVKAIDAYLHQDHCAEVLLVCKSGGMSKSAGDQLVKLGYLRVRDLAGGMMAWDAAGYPLLKDGGT